MPPEDFRRHPEQTERRLKNPEPSKFRQPVIFGTQDGRAIARLPEASGTAGGFKSGRIVQPKTRQGRFVPDFRKLIDMDKIHFRKSLYCFEICL
jgi:hypothetical protein